MTPNDLQRFMNNQEFSQSDIAWLTGKNKRTVQFWLANKYPIPQTVYLLCCAITDGRIDPDWIVVAVEEFKGKTK